VGQYLSVKEPGGRTLGQKNPFTRYQVLPGNEITLRFYLLIGKKRQSLCILIPRWNLGTRENEGTLGLFGRWKFLPPVWYTEILLTSSPAIGFLKLFDRCSSC